MAERARGFLLRGADGLRCWEPTSTLMTSLARPLVGWNSRLADASMRHLPRVGAVTVRSPGGDQFRMRSPGHSEITNRLFWRGFFGCEPATSRTLYRLFSRCESFVDVGANVGYFSLLALAANPSIRVVAFEPMARNFEILSENVLEAFPNRSVVPLRVALASVSGDVEMRHEGHKVQVRSALVESAGSDLPCRSIVAGARFDDLRAVLGGRRLDLVKIDVEGAEAAVLEGMVKSLEADQPLICVEVLSARAGEQLRCLLPDYRPFAITGRGLAAIEGPWVRELGQRNFLWVSPRFERVVDDALS